ELVKLLCELRFGLLASLELRGLTFAGHGFLAGLKDEVALFSGCLGLVQSLRVFVRGVLIKQVLGGDHAIPRVPCLLLRFGQRALCCFEAHRRFALGLVGESSGSESMRLACNGGVMSCNWPLASFSRRRSAGAWPETTTFRSPSTTWA